MGAPATFAREIAAADHADEAGMNAPFAKLVEGTEPEPFDWDKFNAEQDARMAALKVALERWNNAERALDEANKQLVADLRGTLASKIGEVI